jgi:hypothetical protein
LYPLGSTRRILIDEDLMAFESFPNDIAHQCAGILRLRNHRLNAECMVELVVLEPLNDGESNDSIVGTRVWYAAGIQVVWYVPFLNPILKLNLRRAWTQGLEQLEQYHIIQQKKDGAKHLTLRVGKQ